MISKHETFHYFGIGTLICGKFNIYVRIALQRKFITHLKIIFLWGLGFRITYQKYMILQWCLQ